MANWKERKELKRKGNVSCTRLQELGGILVPSGNYNNAENTQPFFSFCDRHSPNEIQVDSKEYSVLLLCAKYCMYHMES